MADKIVFLNNMRSQGVQHEIPLKAHDNGDGTYSLTQISADELAALELLDPTRVNVAALILTTESLSAAVDLAHRSLVSIFMPPAWTAAVLTFQVSVDNVVYGNLYDRYGSEYTIPAASVAQGQGTPVDPVDFVGWRYLKVRSGTAGSAVAQTRVGGTTVTLITRPL